MRYIHLLRSNLIGQNVYNHGTNRLMSCHSTSVPTHQIISAILLLWEEPEDEAGKTPRLKHAHTFFCTL